MTHCTPLHADFQKSTLYVQINSKAVDRIIEHGLTRTESKIFFYLLKFNRDSGEIENLLSLQEIAEATGISAKQTRRSLVKLKELGLCEIKINSSGFRLGKHLSRSSSTTTIKEEA